MGRLTTHRLVRHRLQRGGWLWSPLRASGDHRFIVGALRAQRPHQLPRFPLLLFSTLSSYSPSRVGWSVLDCARRTSTFLLCAFREQEDDQATLPSPCSSALLPVHSTCAIQPGLNSPARSFISRLLIASCGL